MWGKRSDDLMYEFYESVCVMKWRTGSNFFTCDQGLEDSFCFPS